MKKAALMGVLFFLLIPSLFALTSVSQMGYHPSALKTVTVYTSATSGTFSVVRSDGVTVKTGTLSQPLNAGGVAVNCQGNNPCLVGDFTDVTAPGTYKITTSFGEQSKQFNISTAIYANNVKLFGEFFDALSQKGSSYHADLNTFMDPHFPAMADGSYLHTADQAAVTLTRLGDAYRRNPQLLSFDQKTFVKSGTPDIVEHMMIYADYLADLQDTKLQVRSDGVGFRVRNGMRIDGAFVPGPTNMTSINVYSSGNTLIQSTPVTSLCGNLSGTAYNDCVARAANVYKCQMDEPCLQLTFNDQTATRVVGESDGLGVDNGWYYEFACFYDVNLQNGTYNTKVNPCLYYDANETRMNTATTLLAYAEAIPGIYQYDQAKGSSLLGRAIATQAYIKSNYPAFAANDDDVGSYGAANFLLYDMTGNVSFLQEAYNMRTLVSKQLISDSTRGNEFYWQEYIRHKSAMEARGMTYALTGFDNNDPAEAFRGKMFFDYKDRGFLSISNNGEQVFQFDPNVQFQNSRFILTEGVMASKATELTASDRFVDNIADAQLSWLTGNNGVDTDQSQNVNLTSLSFIYGIGSFPRYFHSRLLMDSGYSAATGGTISGMRSIDYKFNNGNGYTFFDGRTYILGDEFGAAGNGWRNETPARQLDTTKVFKNGKTYIPGWISGTFDTQYDQDVIYDFFDNAGAWEYVESTNEIVATGIGLFAYRDARYNNVTPLVTPLIGNVTWNGTVSPNNNSTNSTNTTNTTNTCYNSMQSIPASCTGGTISSDTWNGGRQITCGTTSISAWDKTGYFEMYKQSGTGAQKICIGSTCIQNEGYAKSANFPICIGTNTTNNTNTTACTPTNGGVEICDGKDNNCNGQIDENNVCAPPPPSNSTCYNSVQSIPASCTGGTISADTWNGGRTISCGTTTINAWDKTGYFEMYRQSGTGATKICIGTTCIQNEGYAKSSNFPICMGNNTNTTTCTPTNNGVEICDGKDNNCNGQIDENNVCVPPPTGNSVNVSIAPWYPKGRDYIFLCNANGFTPTSYDWKFGDGNAQYGRTQNDVYYVYSAAGNYNVSCVAKNSATSATGSLKVTVV